MDSLNIPEGCCRGGRVGPGHMCHWVKNGRMVTSASCRVLQPGDSMEIIHRARNSKTPSEPGKKWLSQKGVSREMLEWILMGVMWLQDGYCPSEAETT